MGKEDPQEFGRIVNLADSSGSGDPVARIQNRLSQSRVPSTQNATQWINWNSMSEMLGQPFDTARIPLSKLEQMRRDPMLAFGLAFCKVPLVRAPWYIKSTDARRAAFIDGALRKIYGRLILSYCNAFDFGFSPIVKRFEYDTPDWTYVNEEDLGSSDPSTEQDVWPDKDVKALVWKPFMSLSPRQAAPHWNAAGEFAGIDYLANNGVGAYGWSGTSGFPGVVPNNGNKGRPADIPLDWALWATNEKDSVFGSLYGYPRLGYAYRYWWSYWYKFGLADRAFEKWADPPIKIYYPSDSGLDENGNAVDFASVALETAEQFRSGANVALPSTVIRGDLDKPTSMREWDAEQMETTANFDALNATFEYLDVQKLRAIMVPEQSLVEGKGGSSSRNVASTFGDLFQESQAVVMQEIDDLINRYMIPQLLEANFGPGGPACTKITTGFDPQDIETMRLIVTGFSNTASSALPVDLRELLTRLGIPMLSHSAFQRELDRQAELAAKAKPPEVAPKAGIGGASAGVTKLGQYIQPNESINLDTPLAEDVEITQDDMGDIEKSVGLMERMKKLFGANTEEKTEPQNVHLTFAVEVEENQE